MANPTLTFNPITSVELTDSFVILDPAATVADGGNTLGAIRITLGAGAGSLGIVSGGILTTTGTIGTISYLYEPAKRLLSLTSATATGADFTSVLRAVGYNRGGTNSGLSQPICINLGIPIYSAETGHYYELVAGGLDRVAASTAANAKTFFGLGGYLPTIKSAAENTFLFERFREFGWIGGSSNGTPGTWSWESGPDSGQVFWNGTSTGSAPVGQYASWAAGYPDNSPYIYATFNTGALWYSSVAFAAGYYVEYSTATGTGDDGLGGTRKVFSVFVNYDPIVALLLQSTTAIEVSIVNGVVTSAIGVPIGSVTIGASNGTHIQVSISLGTTNAGKRRTAYGLRTIGGSERELTATRTRVGEIYNFVFLKTVDGSSSVTLLLK